MSTALDDTQRMLEEHAIARLLIRYCADNDAGNWAAVAATYLEDGRMSRPSAPDDFITGRDAILAAFEARPPRRARHVVANILVDIGDDGTATASSQILLFTGPDSAPLVGSYRDLLVKTEAGWRFRERRGSLDFA